ncbi:MAG: hypothetical protein U0Q16_16755 [Bryobacteraceae bacterium]
MPEFIETKRQPLGEISRVHASGTPLQASDRIISIAGKPFRRGLLASTFRNSVPGDMLWLGVQPASGKPAYEIQVKLGDEPLQWLSGPALLVLGAGLLALLIGFRNRYKADARGFVKLAIPMQALWVTVSCRLGMFAGLPDWLQTGLFWFGMGLLALVPGVVWLFFWNFPTQLTSRSSKIVAAAACSLLTVFWAVDIVSALGLGWLSLPATEALGLRRECFVLPTRFLALRVLAEELFKETAA